MNTPLLVLHNHILSQNLNSQATCINLEEPPNLDSGYRPILLEYIEQERPKLIQRFLEGMYDISQRKNENGVRLEDELMLETGLSYWWATSLAESAPYKESFVFEVFKFMALQSWIETHQPSSITLYSNSSTWRVLLQNIAEKFKIPFSVYPKNGPPEKLNSINLLEKTKMNRYSVVVHHFLKRLFHDTLKFPESDANHHCQSAVFTYFPNFEIRDGYYVSAYFRGVSRLFDERRFDWVLVNSLKIRELRPLLTQISEVQHSHLQFLDRYCNSREFLSIVPRFLVLHSKFFKIFDEPNLISFENYPFGSLLENTLKNSLSFYLLEFLLRQYQISQYLDCKPNLKTIYYLMEGQPWELALLKEAQRRSIRTRGVIHSTISDLKLNHYHDIRAYQTCPMPDEILVNGESAKRVYLQQGFREERLIKVEAQRYLHLSHPKQPRDLTRSKLLITTSIDQKENETMLKFFAIAHSSGQNWEEIWLKPHPVSPIKNLIAQFPNLSSVEIKTEKVEELLKYCNVTFSSLSSSVMLESLYSGIPTVAVQSLQYFPMACINQHPLLKIVTNPSELQAALTNFEWVKKNPPQDSYFYLNEDLRLWQKVLEPN